MNKFFTDDLPWKITSLILAFLLWVFVINTQNPIQPQEIAGVRVAITGLEELEELGYKLKNEEEILNQNFKVIVSGPRLEVDRLVRNPKLITATLNLVDYIDDLGQDSVSDTASYTARINLDSYTAVNITDKRPQITKVIIDKIDEKVQKITYEMSKDLTDKYTLIGDGKPIISPDKVTITGPKSDINRVSEARVFIESKDFSEGHLVSNLPIKLYDAEGIEITSLTVSPSVAEVKLPIGSEKKVPIKANFIGTVKEGYVLMNTIISPSEVTIIGKAGLLATINEIELEPIDLSTVEKTDLLQVKMKLPEGIMTLGSNEVTVSLEIVEEDILGYPIDTSELNLTVSGVGEGLSYEILTPSIEVILEALPNKLLDYTKDDIKAVLDLTGYNEGEYTLPLTIIPPVDAKVKNNPITINVRIKPIESEEDTPPTEEEEDAAGEEETPDDVARRR